MLKKIRITLAVITMTLITLLFLDITGTLHHWLGWLAKIQFLPALLALNVGVVVALVVLTLVFGRIYCSVICPLGIMQDVISWLNKKKNRFSYSPEKRWLRYGVLAVFVAAFFLGVNSIVALLAPYSSYGRIAQNLLKPIYEAGNNVLAFFAEHFHHRIGNAAHHRLSGMARRTHLLQHHLPRGNHSQFPCPLLMAENQFQRRQVQEMRPLCAQL